MKGNGQRQRQTRLLKRQLPSAVVHLIAASRRQSCKISQRAGNKGTGWSIRSSWPRPHLPSSYFFFFFSSCCMLRMRMLLLLLFLPPHCLLSHWLSALKRLAATFFADNAVIKIQLQLKVRTQNGQRQTK